MIKQTLIYVWGNLTDITLLDPIFFVESNEMVNLSSSLNLDRVAKPVRSYRYNAV